MICSPGSFLIPFPFLNLWNQEAWRAFELEWQEQLR